MEDSKDYLATMIVTNEEMQCNGYMDFLCRNMKEQISNGILAVVSDGNEYAIKMLPEQRIKKPDMLSVEIRQGISVKELVRCKECKYCYAEGFVNVRNVCEKHYDFGNVDDDWFCADGERKEQERE